MPILTNPKHELYAQERAKGRSQIDAYTATGNKASYARASDWEKREDIAVRVAELLAVVAERAVVTIHDIADQLDEDRKFAREMEAPGPAIQATMGKAKVLGLLTEKVEHTGKDGGPIELADRELAQLIVFQLQKAAKGG